MAIVVLTCTHCSVERLAFSVHYTMAITKGLGALHLHCPHCSMPVAAVVGHITATPRPLDELRNYGGPL